ncbi:DUF4893 domain-containing protein [Sphingomonas glaciei]|uniref:DUF4893 domain-containing protein n=1 Tax=Sphingomonas glaciei TaxID=2938948 RepID=A0ABY5MR08_9SPHN|nr:DUF4893 domain-containing protein [Sphingomonas glaciei]UUR06920.1 DUF4893 domain-containing protein [Sphingomonas glaciei]
MMIARPGSILALSLILAGCMMATPQPLPAPPAPVAEPPSKAERWLTVATAPDTDRLRRLPFAWTDGLRDARVRYASAVREEGDLLRPDAALARPAPTPGSYNCRLVRLGSTDRRSPAFVQFKPFFCYVEVEDDLLTVVKQTGSERPAGRLWDDDVATRLVFLGTVALGNEARPKPYGADQTRDMAGFMERIGPMRWRLVLPNPRSGAKLEVFELTPVADQPKR